MRKLSSIFVITVLAACTDTSEQPVALSGTVDISEMSPARIAGTFTVQDDTLDYEARELEPNLISVTLRFHGLTFDSTLDTRDGNRMWSQDAFATDTGLDTTLNEDDIKLVFAFVKSIEKEDVGVSQGDGLAFHFGVVINYWAEWIPAMDPRRIKFEDRLRAQDMCWWAQDTTGNWPTGGGSGPSGGTERWGSYDGHDCDACEGDPVQGQGASNCSSNFAYGNWYGDTTWYWYNSSWHTDSNGHGGGTSTYLEGNCYGRYGAGCGSGHAYFRENGSHDHCVRNNHVTWSAWCSDELARTTAPYNCY